MNVPLSKKVWEMFVRDGVLDSSRLGDRISESWYLCKKAGVNPHGGEGRRILDENALSERRKNNAQLLDLARPYMDQLYRSMRNSGVILLLIDADGFVLLMKGDEATLQLAKDINFIQGVQWTEQEVGTNAIGTALRTGEAIAVVGTEHYAVASQNWTCAAAPIHDPEGNVLGILDISSPVFRNHPHTLAAVTSAAYAIEHKWEMMEKNRELELFKSAYPLLTSDQLLVICNFRHQVLLMSEQIKAQISSDPPFHLEQVFDMGYRIEQKKTLRQEKGGDILGYAVYLQPESVPTTQVAFGQPFYFDGEKGTSTVFQALLQKASQVAAFDTDVYIYGETGTGKEVLARAIHQNSSRKKHPFVAINCGAIPSELLESELFGYAEGAFTGAKRKGHKGKFLQAQRGTLFLDEVSELTLPMQVALLRVLQEREVTPLGGSKPIAVDIRVISASNQDLSQKVREGQFRADLFYRLHAFPLEIPPLRERKEDIPALIRYYCRQHSWHVRFPQDVLQTLLEHDWPGNVRELFHVLEYMRIVSKEQMPQRDHLPPLIVQELRNMSAKGVSPLLEHPAHDKQEKESSLSPSTRLTYREQLEKEKMMQALRETEGQVSRAARMLKMPRSTFYRKLKKYNL